MDISPQGFTSRLRLKARDFLPFPEGDIKQDYKDLEHRTPLAVPPRLLTSAAIETTNTGHLTR
jgi:hypothetical protein